MKFTCTEINISGTHRRINPTFLWFYYYWMKMIYFNKNRWYSLRRIWKIRTNSNLKRITEWVSKEWTFQYCMRKRRTNIFVLVLMLSFASNNQCRIGNKSTIKRGSFFIISIRHHWNWKEIVWRGETEDCHLHRVAHLVKLPEICLIYGNMHRIFK